MNSIQSFKDQSEPLLYAICLVKNEADVITDCLEHAARYCDQIFVLDNNSSDETWRKVNELAEHLPSVVPFAVLKQPYSNGLRALAYNAVHNQLSTKDWWLRLDSDEFLTEDPKPLLRRANARGADFVQAWQCQFYFTDEDLKAWQTAGEDRSKPVYERRRYYQVDWREYRLFRNQPMLAWDASSNPQWPQGLTRVHPERIILRHYQYRDPEQIAARLKIRYALRQSTQAAFSHVKSVDWRTTVRATNGLSYYTEGKPIKIDYFYFYRSRIRSKLKEILLDLKKQVKSFMGTCKPSHS